MRGGCCFEYDEISYYPPFWPEDDIVSPMWDFIKHDNRKQNRSKRHFKTVKRVEIRYKRHNLTSSRSGYRGVKALKRG